MDHGQKRHQPGLYLNPSLTVDVLIFTVVAGALKVLLIKRGAEPFSGLHALPGGFMLTKENSEEAAYRLLNEKAGFLQHPFIEQLYTFDTKGRDPRGPVISIVYMALVEGSHITELMREATFELFNVKKLPGLAFDHNDIISYGVGRLKSKLEYTNSAYSLLPESFTMSALLSIYQAIFGESLDKRNFSRKILSIDMIKETKELLKGGRQRPAKLYTFKEKSIVTLGKFL
jgi:8-oxo-dGTP diphosphatase